MILDELKYIIETQIPRNLRNRLVTPDEAQAVLVSYQRLSDPNRAMLLNLPIDNIIDFAMTRNKSNRLQGYMSQVETKKPIGRRLEEQDYLDVPISPPVAAKRSKPVSQKLVETIKADPPAKPIQKKRVQEKTARKSSAQQQEFFNRLIEQINELKRQPIAHAAATEAHVKRLCEIEQAMLSTLNSLSKRMERSSKTQANLTEVIATQQKMIETQAELVHALYSAYRKP